MDDIEELPKNIIKGKMKMKGLKVKDMVLRLEKEGEKMTEQTFNSKMNRASFSAVFFFKCMKALNVKTITIED